MTIEKFTPYQQSLVDECSSRTWINHIRRWVSIFAVVLLCGGFIARFYNSIPSAFDGWLVFISAGYILLNWFGAIMGGFMNSLMFLLKMVMESTVLSQDFEKLKYKTRGVIATFAKKSHLLGAFNFNISTIIDVIADWALFFVLVTVNHPYMAILHVLPLILQYKAVSSAKKNLLQLIVLLPDPLDETEKTNIDELMDKLCDPSQDK